MNNGRFVFISTVIFGIKFFLAVLSPFLLLADPFIILTLTVFLKNQKVHMAVFVIVAFFFDFWSGDFFGVSTLALLLSILIIFLIKKVVMIDHRGWFAGLFWVVMFYYLYILLHELVSFIFVFGSFLFPRIYFSWLNLIGTILWTILIMFLVNKFSYAKRVSGF